MHVKKRVLTSVVHVVKGLSILRVYGTGHGAECCVHGMQVRHLFLLMRGSGTTIGSRNNCYTPGEWKDKESPSLKMGGLPLIAIYCSSLLF